MSKPASHLRLINNALKQPKLQNVKCTVVLPNGETDYAVATVALNKVHKLSGNGLSGNLLYQLQKTGSCETTDHTGTKFLYQYVTADEAAELRAAKSKPPVDANQDLTATTQSEEKVET